MLWYIYLNKVLLTVIMYNLHLEEKPRVDIQSYEFFKQNKSIYHGTSWQQETPVDRCSKRLPKKKKKKLMGGAQTRRRYKIWGNESWNSDLVFCSPTQTSSTYTEKNRIDLAVPILSDRPVCVCLMMLFYYILKMEWRKNRVCKKNCLILLFISCFQSVCNKINK